MDTLPLPRRGTHCHHQTIHPVKPVKSIIPTNHAASHFVCSRVTCQSGGFRGTVFLPSDRTPPPLPWPRPRWRRVPTSVQTVIPPKNAERSDSDVSRSQTGTLHHNWSELEARALTGLKDQRTKSTLAKQNEVRLFFFLKADCCHALP